MHNNKPLTLLILLVISLQLTQSQYCMNAAGEPVAWWIVLKVPPMIGNSGYGYYDSVTGAGSIKYVNKTIDLDVSPLTQTLSLLNKNKL